MHPQDENLHDDGTAVGTEDELKRMVSIVKRDGPERGLHLQPDKSSVWSPSPLAPGVKDPIGCGIKQVGAPIGSGVFVAQFVKKKIENCPQQMMYIFKEAEL